MILILIICANMAYSFLNPRDQDIIRIAFMNGYVEALNLSFKEKEKMKNNKALLSKTVKSAAERYLKKVEKLN